MRVMACFGVAFFVVAAVLQSAVETRHEQTAMNAAAPARTIVIPTLRLLAVPFPSVAADLAWIHAVQHFASLQRSPNPASDQTLSTLIDLTVTADPGFLAAYRVGALLLVEPPPRGPGQPDAATRLLERGMQANPSRWQLVFDLGFLRYRWHREYDRAAAAFLRASRMPRAPWWLTPLAANTLAEGGRRAAARALWQAQLVESELPWMRQQAARRLHQLEALDGIDDLQRRVDEARVSGVRPPHTWEALRSAGWLRVVPDDPAGTPYVVDPETGRVGLSDDSPLAPLPDEGGFRVP